ncbi:cation diffusion facilitator family transporter [Sphingomonas prati]|nr:cation diffusion facilitator family transporter [Sphingomonas prati]GGE83670.1 cation efflux system protein [Sphingomonas prati]
MSGWEPGDVRGDARGLWQADAMAGDDMTQDHSGHSHGHGHGHGHGGGHHDHTAGADVRSLRWALALTAFYLLVEVVGAFWFNSLALLSDAAHMMTDVAALVIALAAISIGARPADDRRTFGYKRFEILAAAFNALLLFAVAIYVLIEAVQRFRTPQPIESGGMMAVAVLGLIVNFASMRLLSAGRDGNLNMKGAYLEVWADAIGSVGVIAGAVAIRFTGWTWIDPVVAIGIGLWVVPRTWTLLRDTINVLLEGVPGGMNLPDIRAGIGGIAGVGGVHDLHVWSVSSDAVNCTVHVELTGGADADGVRHAVATWLAARHGIGHSTIQTETAAQACGHRDHLHP